MARKKTDHHFAADVPGPIWSQFEKWLQGRGKLSNPQIGAVLLRLFLAAPEGIRLLAFAGRDSDGLADGFRAIMRDVLWEQIKGGFGPSEIAIVSPDEGIQQFLEMLTQRHDPERVLQMLEASVAEFKTIVGESRNGRPFALTEWKLNQIKEILRLYGFEFRERVLQIVQESLQPQADQDASASRPRSTRKARR